MLNTMFIKVESEAPTRLVISAEVLRVKWRGKVKATPRTERLYGCLGRDPNENVDELHLDSNYPK